MPTTIGFAIVRLTVKFSTFVLLSSPSPFFLAEKRKLANKNGYGLLRC
ncbi:hypothetical protein SAMN04487894_1384 [Niabella drilacis]|uniref:Uncharacterized protein n=1 Tax=Niabella drilacis (strain DSM 25811 / CCM 8410 / CCUG 62505 / LMG 26954 / E90) TaxID=1285928 RepID=A0A1G7C3W1_NIADE|nr:hypothetical protein SAMN04487894_1384 [Niabella drilacis]